MSSKIDIHKYNYIMFVDASGDDGYKFAASSSEGSSFSFVVSCFVTPLSELEYNKDILLAMKKALFVKPEQELKSTALKRHRNARAAYEKMASLHGFAYSIITNKRLIQDIKPDEVSDIGTMSLIAQIDLSGITHTFPSIAFQNSGLLKDTDKVLIVIDNMKKREMDRIKDIFSSDNAKQFDLIFRDSKDKDFPLIQIADIMCGTIRSYYESSIPLGKHNYICKNCMGAQWHTAKKGSPFIKRCTTKSVRKLFVPYINNTEFNTVMRFHRCDDEPNPRSIGNHFIILPIEQLPAFAYISCMIIKDGYL